MVANVKEVQTKDLLQRASIRTMKKDIAHLREADALKEREKIGKLKISKEPLKNTIKPTLGTILGKDPVTENKATNEPIIASGNVPRSTSPQPSKLNVTDKSGEARYNTAPGEAEKQQIFQLQSQKTDLQQKLATTATPSNPSLILEKNKLVLEEKNLQKKIDLFVLEEEKQEQELQNLEKQEQTTNVPEQKEKIQKTRLALEEEKGEAAKKRWIIENQLAELKGKLNEFNDSDEQKDQEVQNLQTKIQNVSHSLEDVYSAIEQKEVARKSESLAPKTEDKNTQTPQQTWSKPSISDKPARNFSTGQGLQQSDKARMAMEKLTKTPAVEEERRRKFLEDIENWAKEEK